MAFPVAAQRAELVEIPEAPSPERVAFALYTVQDQVLKMTAQWYAAAREFGQALG